MLEYWELTDDERVSACPGGDIVADGANTCAPICVCRFVYVCVRV